MFHKKNEYKEQFGQVLDDFLLDFNKKLLKEPPDDLLNSLDDNFLKKTLGNSLGKLTLEEQRLVWAMSRSDRCELFVAAIRNNLYESVGKKSFFSKSFGVTEGISVQNIRDILHFSLPQVRELLVKIEVTKEASKHHKREGHNMQLELLEHSNYLKQELVKLRKMKISKVVLDKVEAQLQKLEKSIVPPAPSVARHR